MPDTPIFETTFYRNASGDEPVREFLRALSQDARLKCGRYMQQLEWRGLELKASHLKKVAGDLWELRPEYGNVEYRLFFGIAGKYVVYVHVVVKKSQKVDRDDLALAQRRFNEWKAINDDKRT